MYPKGAFGPKIPFFCAILLAEFWVPLPPKQKLVCQTKLAAMGVTICTVLKSFGNLAVIWKNPDSFEIIRKIGSHLEKIRTVLKF